MSNDSNNFSRQLGLAVLILLGLLVLDRLPLRKGSLPARTVGRVVAEMHNGELNAEDLHILAAGYYEGLRNDVPVAGVNPNDDGMSTVQSDVRSRRDFLLFEFRPDVKRPYPSGLRFTNSLGMPNPEYGWSKPPNTRRIALLGDSLSVGPYGHDYVALLEARLNHDAVTPATQKFQILNFSVYGYSVLQMMDLAIEQAPRFHPDVYIVAMTSLEFMDGEGWRDHVGRLVLNRTDLKYQYLRDVVAKAGVRPTDRLAAMATKLQPFSIPVTRWALERIHEHADAEGAPMLIVLIPGVINPDFTAADFDRLHPAMDSLGVPIIDLRDTFRGVDLRDFEVLAGKDFHPNAQGHERIFEGLYGALRSQPKVMTMVTSIPK